jgi:hypothetical protein
MGACRVVARFARILATFLAASRRLESFARVFLAFLAAADRVRAPRVMRSLISSIAVVRSDAAGVVPVFNMGFLRFTTLLTR